MSKIAWTWNRLHRVGDRIDRRVRRISRRWERVSQRLEKNRFAALRMAHIRARVGRMARRIERVEMRRQDVLRALKAKWLSEWHRVID
jgi:hypothetical protein